MDFVMHLRGGDDNAARHLQFRFSSLDETAGRVLLDNYV
jgi:hypothetical protein